MIRHVVFLGLIRANPSLDATAEQKYVGEAVEEGTFYQVSFMHTTITIHCLPCLLQNLQDRSPSRKPRTDAQPISIQFQGGDADTFCYLDA